MAKYSSKAFPGTHPWQDFRLMYDKRGLGRKNTPSVATYRRYASKMSWSWQDLRAAYLKSPANRCLGIHIVKILPGRGDFPVRGPFWDTWSEIIATDCRPGTHRGGILTLPVRPRAHQGAIPPPSDAGERISRAFCHRQAPGKRILANGAASSCGRAYCLAIALVPHESDDLFVQAVLCT